MASSGQNDPESAKDGPETAAGLLDAALADARELTEVSGDELEAALREVAPGASAEDALARAARLEADRRLFQACAKEEFDGPRTNKLLLIAHEYAMPVIGDLIRTGKIFRAATRLRRPVRRQDGDVAWTVEERSFLTESTVDLGIFGVFHKHGLMKAGWDHRRGAALTTYATNGCVLCFKQVYQKWWRGKVLEYSVGDLELELPQHAQVDLHLADPGDQAVDRVEAERLLGQFPEQVREALVWRALHGATQAEAAARVGLSEKALESRLGRARNRLGLTRGGPSSGTTSESEPDDELGA